MEIQIGTEQLDATFAVAMAAAPPAVRAMLQNARTSARVDGQISLDSLLRTLEEKSGQLEKEAEKMEEIREWYSNCTAALESETCVKVRQVEYLAGRAGMLITVGVFPMGVEDALEGSEEIGVLKVTLTSTMKLKDATLNLTTGRPIDISDVISASQQMVPPTDLKFLTIECGRRARSSIIRRRHIQALQERYLVARSTPEQTEKMIPAAEMLLVTLAPGVVVKVHITPEYPYTPASVRIVELVGAVNWRLEELQAVEVRVNADKHQDLVSLVGDIDNVLRDVDPMIDDPETGNPVRKP